MYRRILVPLDGSSTALNGLAQALLLAKDQKAVVRVLNVVDDITTAMRTDPFAAVELVRVVDSSRQEGRKALQAAEVMAQKATVQVETVQIEGRGNRVSEVILRDAKKWRPDLIVMGTHGRRGINRLLLGSDAERVLRATPVPMLLVRMIEKPKRPRRKRVR